MISGRMNKREAGNILIYILGTIVLMGVLFTVLRGNSQEGMGIDAEKTAIRVNEARQQAAGIERAVSVLLNDGISESDLRFGHPDADAVYGLISDEPSRQVFSAEGGGMEYRLPPSGINDGTKWQFSGSTHMPQVGSDVAAQSRGELVAILPNVSEAFCYQMNVALGQDIDLSVDTDPGSDGCVYSPGDEFDGTFASGTDNNTLDATKIPKLPPMELCVKCNSDGKFHYYRVLLAR